MWTWIDDILDLLHVLWYGVIHTLNNAWACVRVPFWIYVVVMVAFIVNATILGFIGFGAFFAGAVTGKNWVTFAGLMVLIGGVILVGIALVPAVLAIELVRTATRKLRGGAS